MKEMCDDKLVMKRAVVKNEKQLQGRVSEIDQMGDEFDEIEQKTKQMMMEVLYNG